MHARDCSPISFPPSPSTTASALKRLLCAALTHLVLVGAATGCAVSDPAGTADETGSFDADDDEGSGGEDGVEGDGDDDGEDGGDGDGDGGDGGAAPGSGVTASTGSSVTSGAGGGGEDTQTPVRLLPGLTSITFYETTNEVNAYTFAVDGPELSTKLADPLGEAFDIGGAASELYDVYYSDENGSFDLDGSYLTISGVYETQAPYGGGLNLAEIGLGLDDGSEELGNYVASFVALGDNADPASAAKCIDGELETYTTMGNTRDSDGRLRLTLGFLSTSGPPRTPL